MGRDSPLGDGLDFESPRSREASALPVGNDLGRHPESVSGGGLATAEVVEKALVQIHEATLHDLFQSRQQIVCHTEQNVYYSPGVDKETFKENLSIQPLLDWLEENDETQSQFARRLNVSPQVITNWKTRGIPRGELLTVAPAIGLTAEEYVSLALPPEKRPKATAAKRIRSNLSAAEPASRYAMIPHYNVRAGLGNAKINEHHVEIEADFPVPLSLIQRKGWRLEALRVITMEGDSMETTIYDGDPGVINTDFTKIRNGGVYAFIDSDGAMSVKRLHRERDGRVRVMSDNLNKLVYPDTWISPDDRIEIIGELVHRSGSP